MIKSRNSSDHRLVRTNVSNYECYLAQKFINGHYIIPDSFFNGCKSANINSFSFQCIAKDVRQCDSNCISGPYYK